MHAFILLKRHAYMLTKERRVDSYVGGLNIALKSLVDATCPATFEQAQNVTLKQERNMGLSKAPGLGYARLAGASFSMGTNPSPDQPQRPFL